MLAKLVLTYSHAKLSCSASHVCFITMNKTRVLKSFTTSNSAIQELRFTLFSFTVIDYNAQI
jgi:hypothetical protein